MKKWLLLLSASFMAATGYSQASGLGLGLMVGVPTGISGKVWTGGANAVAFGTAWGGWGRGGYFHLHADYLFHNFDLINVSEGRMALHYGVGARFRSWGGDRYWVNGGYVESRGGHARLGVRLPVGLTYLFDGAPVDIFLEAAPSLDLIPGTSFHVDGSLGARYYF